MGQRIANWIFGNPRAALAAMLGITVLFAAQIPGMKLASNFDDLLPTNHPFIQLHEEVRQIFGGANVLTVVLEVEEGTIFTNEILTQIQRITEAVDRLPGVNHNLVSSLTYHNTRRMVVDEFGDVQQRLYYDAQAEPLTDEELEALKDYVQVDPRVYGRYVSTNLKLARITAHMTTAESDVMIAVFEGVQQIREAEQRPGIRIHAVGNPILTGWVYNYFVDITQVLLYTIALVLLLLIAYFRSLYGVLLPLAGIALSSAWGLGFLNLIGLNLDPVSMPIVFLLAARATSHGVQIVERFNYELARVEDNRRAARNTFGALIRPGSLAIITDAIGILAISFGSAPYHLSLATYAGFWAITILFTVNLMLPVVLSSLPKPRDTLNKRERTSTVIRNLIRPLANRSLGKVVLVMSAATVLIASVIATTRVEFGIAEGGTPLLHQTHEYNLSAARIAGTFPGTEPLYIVARVDTDVMGKRDPSSNGYGDVLVGDGADGVRDPRVLRAMDALERFMLENPAVHGSRVLSGLVKQVNRLIYEGDPRWAQVPENPLDAGGVMFAYEFSSPLPNALRQYVNHTYTLSNMAFFLPDTRASTINTAMSTAKEMAPRLAGEVDGLTFELAAGAAGVNAAINDANFTDTIIVTTFVLVAIFLVVAMNYRSIQAGLLMFASMIFAISVSYAYLGIAGIGVHANIIPVIAIGIGMGIDYAIYTVDRIRSEVARGMSVEDAVAHSLSTTGLAVAFTVLTLVAGVIMWVFSDLRFQSEAALLLVVMISVFAIGALVILPSWVIVFRPRFVCQGR